ncbi:MAG: phosphotransferase family protein [Betaproteobacteria bacterium]|jgi:aminoglycoside phosphotransferase (APT) family kinase protein|nr:phosphotransferase family protein [Betaproteobacteria bacterium]
MAATNYAILDAPTREFMAHMQLKYPTERETNELLVRKLERRTSQTQDYHVPRLSEMEQWIHAFFTANLDAPFHITHPRWLAGGASKLQVLFEIEWQQAGKARQDRMVVRMDPAESHNATSRLREAELLRAFRGVIPVPEVFFVDEQARWFPEPALIYAFSDGVTKPKTTASGAVSGLGIRFGADLRAKLGPQFVEHLAKIHAFPIDSAGFTTMESPSTGTTEAAQLQLNRARRVWEEDRGEDFPLMDVAVNWLSRNLPVLDQVSVIHGDYRSGNFLFDEASARITTWLDWERGHLGDRHRDLAWITQAMFGDPRDDGQGYYICGLLSEQEFHERYQNTSGLVIDPVRLQWYSVLNCYQALVSTLGSCYRVVRMGKNHQDALMVALKAEAAMASARLQEMLMEIL